MILELNVARLQNRLSGETPAERFASFAELLRRPEFSLKLLAEYPALARVLVTVVENWLDSHTEFFRRLGDDWESLRATFGDDADPGPLTELKGGAGDAHRGGRTVLIAGFASGLRLVYKPRSLAADVHFQELLAWLNQRGDHPPFRLPVWRHVRKTVAKVSRAVPRRRASP